ncbi:sigma-70 family RNA polymerase sigma factor [Kribbella albertanoniae]|uniref:Sigma-70 family RNA polymerase sigma factor n=1 Tax=Kribbella albertanoniae TaxID=1266829 RepID=A0A4R4PU80_9ACTN|nr:RNA polymerase subunit sigma-70 [Kribbella albertanoniae]TDC25783.1 sigma-70 family RNA polymerase sigma factor [Kribbella albertanoniae]
MADDEVLLRELERLHHELLAHCYRMMGSVDEAEDMLQETSLRAWKSYQNFDGRASVRVWLYRIATNTCLTALKHRSRRFLPSGLGAPTDDPDAPVRELGAGVRMVQPIPQALLDPAAIVGSRETLRLGVIASLQHLPVSQRAVLILRDVLSFSAAETAEVLETTTTAVKSSLQRARGKMAEVAPRLDEVSEPNDPVLSDLLDRYIAAIEASDAAALAEVLHHDAVLQAAGTSTWFAGLKTCLRFLMDRVLVDGPGSWRMLPTAANGQPAAADYIRRSDGSYEAFGLVVLDITYDGVRGITSFADPTLVERSGLPLLLAR